MIDVLDLRCGDCTYVLDDLINEGVKVDLIITSPPYNLGMTDRGIENRQVVVLYDGYKDNMNFDDYFCWQVNILNKCYDLLSDRGLLYYNHKERHIDGRYFNPINIVEKSKFNPLQTIIWNRAGGVNFNIGRYVNCYEQIVVAYKCNKQYMKVSSEYEKYFDVWNIPPTRNYMQVATFPLEIPDRIIGGYLSEYKDITVLDPFMGSGTTGVSCKKFGVNFIGIEINDDYFKNAKQRINDVNESGYGITDNAKSILLW